MKMRTVPLDSKAYASVARSVGLGYKYLESGEFELRREMLELITAHYGDSSEST